MAEPVLQISYSLSNIGSAADQFWQYAHQHRVLAFSGEMGAGKTTFIHALCDLLGVTDAVSSPTFALINEYHFMQDSKDITIWHMDWYRLNSIEDAINAGMEDTLHHQDAYCFVEWAEKAVGLLPHPHLWISIEPVSTDMRHIKVYVKG